MADDLQQHAAQTIWRRQVAQFIGDIMAVLSSIPTWTIDSKTFDPGSIASGTQVQTTVTVNGAVLGNFAVASFSLDLQGAVLTAAVSSANTATVTFRNDTGAPVVPGSGTLTAAVFA